ncbi:MAG: hypothetical protein M0R17_01740 [Candidatus Omnitrophica bacterium]|jgi:hypothetical protein|nr:hypothetical protein [Candidatus Omnitrophota bacterium]
MGIFSCEKCGCMENTALSKYWSRGEGPVLCSECDPKIGKWHGRFEKKSAAGMLIGSDGFLYSSEIGLEWRKEHQGFKIVGMVK